MDHFNKGAFLIRRKEINQLKNNNTIGGEIVWKSGKFNFELEKDTKSGWFFGKKKNNEESKETKELKEIEAIKKETVELIKIQAENELKYKNYKKMVNIAKEETQNLVSKDNIDKKQKGKLGEYIQVPDFLKKQEEQLEAMKKLANKGKQIRLYEIDELINKYGNTESIRNFVNSFGLIKIEPPKEEKLFKNEEEINLIKKTEGKKLA